MSNYSKDYVNTLTGKTGPTEYLGDGAYAQFLPWSGTVLIYTSNGEAVQNEVYLDPFFIKDLVQFLKTQGVEL